jgi:ankyrin repeat protein
MALHREDLETAKVLLEFGTNAKTGNSLSIAVDRGNLNAVRLLLDHGADPNSKPTGEQMPLYSAAAKGDTNLMQLLLEKIAKVDWSPIGSPTTFYMAVIREDAKAVKVLLSYGADVNATGAGGETVLGYAMKNGSEEIK